MVKSIFIFILSLLFVKAALAQKRDTAVYYLKSTGIVVSTKDSADFFLIILPPDTSVDKKLFIVKEFYPDGKIRLVGNSSTRILETLKFHGSQITFFPNGRKMRIKNFKNGEPIGDAVEYYPDGRLYNIKTYTNDKIFFLKQCNDSIGNIIAENGSGKWINFLDETFKGAYIKGEIKNGQEEGEWRGEAGSEYFALIYHKGKLLSSSHANKRSVDKRSDSLSFKPIEEVPEFPGGLEAFGRFLARNLRYTATARENKTQGRVIVSFIVEKDGSLSDIKVARGVGDGLDEEALRVMRLSPHWKPGMQDAKPVRVAYSVPIAFTLSN
jgi:TonB family protein